MSIDRATPVTAFVPVAPDADWDTVRTRLTDALTATAVPAWTDHNAADPGITLLEVLAFGLADLHYRVAERRYDAWPLEVRGWLADADRHWHATLPHHPYAPDDDPTLPADALEPLSRVADALAAPGPTSAAVLEPAVRAAASRADALTVLSSGSVADAFAPEHRPAVVALLRSRLVREVAFEQADLVADVVAAHAERDPALVTPARVAAGDAAAAAELGLALPLWEEEVTALVRRERRRLSQEALVRRLQQVRAALTAADASAVRDALAGDGLDATEAAVAVAAATAPPGLVPEDLEDASGRSLVWPPHPVQALTCEPVTLEDYARRARSHPGVGRAWAVRGRLDGIAWNGLPTGTVPSVAVDAEAAALTLVVERVPDPTLEGPAPTDDAFLRSVLAVAVGPEVRAPFPDWRDDVDDLEPRRLMCDEVGAGLLAVAPVLVQATLVTGVGADRTAVVDDVRRRVSEYFARGRPESRERPEAPGVDGPWPRVDQPGTGWLPGEPVRFTEVVEAMVGNPLVLGVEALAMKVEGDAHFVTAADADPVLGACLPLPAGAVPELAEARCVRVRLALTTECGR